MGDLGYASCIAFRCLESVRCRRDLTSCQVAGPMRGRPHSCSAARRSGGAQRVPERQGKMDCVGARGQQMAQLGGVEGGILRAPVGGRQPQRGP